MAAEEEAQPAPSPDALQRVVSTLRCWSLEGPPRNPRAAAGELAANLQAALADSGCAAARAAEIIAQGEEGARRRAELEKEVERLQALLEELQCANQSAEERAAEREALSRSQADSEQARLAAAHAEEVAGLQERLRCAEALAGEREAMCRADAEALAHRRSEQALAAGLDEAMQLRRRASRLSSHLCAVLPPVSAACRVRPMESYGADASKGPRKTSLAIEGGDVTVEHAGRSRRFRVDRLLDGQATQEDLFSTAAPWVENAAIGGASCVFAYGATGSGKTHSMLGNKGGSVRGLAHHALHQLMEGSRGTAQSSRCRVKISMLEVYCEQIRDLLAPPADGGGPPTLQCSRRDGRGRMLLDCVEVEASEVSEAEEVLRRGFRNRKTEGTLCNEQSSRSHVVLTVKVEAGRAGGAGGRMTLVDLAGSENVQRSGADEGGQLLHEAKAINRSLSALGDVIEATAKQQAFVPYRNSRLTMLLEEPLSASKVLLLAHVSPMARDATDTAHSLQFAGHVRGVDFGAQRLRQEQEEQQRAAYRSKEEAQRSQHEAKQLQSQLDQARQAQQEAQRSEKESRQQVTSLTEQLRESKRELAKEQALRLRAEASAEKLPTPRYTRHGSTGCLHQPPSQGWSSPPPPSRLAAPQKRAPTPGAAPRESWRAWTDAPVEGEAPAQAPSAGRTRPERSPLGDRTNQEGLRAAPEKKESTIKPAATDIIGLPKELVDIQPVDLQPAGEEDDALTKTAAPMPARSPERSPLRCAGAGGVLAPVASPQRSAAPSPLMQERTVIGLVDKLDASPLGSPRGSPRGSPTRAEEALAPARPRLSFVDQGETERPPTRYNIYDGVQVRSVLRQQPTDFKARLLGRLSATPRPSVRRVAFAEQQPHPASPPRWYLDMMENKLQEETPAATAPPASSPRSLTPPIRRREREATPARHASTADTPARWR